MPVLKLCFTPSGEIRRIAALDEPPKYDTLEQLARRFFSIADAPIKMTYQDDEAEIVTVSTDEEVADAFAQAQAARGSLKLFVSSHSAAVSPPPPRAVHPGVTCDRSGMSPIVGPRFHLPGRDYDLCEAEFLKLDAAARKAFVRIDRPAAAACASACAARAARAARLRQFATATPPAPVRCPLDAGPLLELFAGLGDLAGGGSLPDKPRRSAAAAACEEKASVLSALGAGAAEAADVELQRAIEASIGVPAPATAPPPARARGNTEQKSDSGDEEDFVAVSPQLSPALLPPTADMLPMAPVDAAASLAKSTRFDSELAELASLGFGDDADRNLALLERFNGRVFRVVNAILDMAGAD